MSVSTIYSKEEIQILLGDDLSFDRKTREVLIKGLFPRVYKKVTKIDYKTNEDIIKYIDTEIESLKELQNQELDKDEINKVIEDYKEQLGRELDLQFITSEKSNEWIKKIISALKNYKKTKEGVKDIDKLEFLIENNKVTSTAIDNLKGEKYSSTIFKQKIREYKNQLKKEEKAPKVKEVLPIMEEKKDKIKDYSTENIMKYIDIEIQSLKKLQTQKLDQDEIDKIIKEYEEQLGEGFGPVSTSSKKSSEWIKQIINALEDYKKLKKEVKDEDLIALTQTKIHESVVGNINLQKVEESLKQFWNKKERIDLQMIGAQSLLTINNTVENSLGL